MVLLFRNAGAQELVIHEAVTTCACGHQVRYDARVAPGAVGTVAVVISTGAREGALDGEVRMAVSATGAGATGQRQSSAVPFRVIMPSRPVASPAFVHWMQQAAPRAQVVQVSVPGDSPYRLTGEVSAGAGFSATLTQAAQAWTLTIVPASTATGAQAEIHVATSIPVADGGRRPGRPVVVYARVVAPKTPVVAPSQVEAARSPDTNPLLMPGATAAASRERDPNEIVRDPSDVDEAP